MKPNRRSRVWASASISLIVLAVGVSIACGGQSTPTAPEEQFAGGTAAATTKRGGQPKVDICHFDKDSGTWKLLNIAAPAVEAHATHHRDGVPFGEVPDSPGNIFDGDCIPVSLGIEIEKSTEGQDADEPPGPVLFVNDPVNWEYAVTNTGELALVDIKVVDDQGVTISCPLDELDPGESMICTASGTVVEGQYKNTGTVTGSSCKDGGSAPCNGATPVQVTDSDDSHYLGELAQISCPVDVSVAVNLSLNPMPQLICGSSGHVLYGPLYEIGPGGVPTTTDYAVSNGGRCLGSGFGFRGVCDRDLGVPSGTGDSRIPLTPEAMSACTAEFLAFAAQLQAQGLLYPGSSNPASCAVF
jgi:hypothetical protein